MAEKKRKPNLSPEAAKILQQYRSAGKSNGDSAAAPDSGDQSGTKPSSAPHAPPVHRSGTRGK